MGASGGYVLSSSATHSTVTSTTTVTATSGAQGKSSLVVGASGTSESESSSTATQGKKVAERLQEAMALRSSSKKWLVFGNLVASLDPSQIPDVLASLKSFKSNEKQLLIYQLLAH